MSVPVHSAPTVQTSSVCKTAPLYMPADGRIALNSPQASIEMPADQAAILQLDVGQLAEQEVTSKSSKGKHAAGSDEPGLNSHKRHRPEEQVQMSQEPLGLTAASPAAQSMVAPKAGQACDAHVSIALSIQTRQHQQEIAQAPSDAAGAQPGRLGQADALKAPDEGPGTRMGCMTMQAAGGV